MAMALHATPALAQADARERARVHFENGEALYREGNHAEAIRQFEAANALVPSPILTFNIGLAHEKLGHDEKAIAQFQRYLKERPDAPNKAAVQERIARARERVARAKQPLYKELDDDAPPSASAAPEAPPPPLPPAPPSADPSASPGPAPSASPSPVSPPIPPLPGPPSSAPSAPPVAEAAPVPDPTQTGPAQGPVPLDDPLARRIPFRGR